MAKLDAIALGRDARKSLEIVLDMNLVMRGAFGRFRWRFRIAKVLLTAVSWLLGCKVEIKSPPTA
jgi:hypothetical protein